MSWRKKAFEVHQWGRILNTKEEDSSHFGEEGGSRAKFLLRF